jgi:hypothetical protein
MNTHTTRTGTRLLIALICGGLLLCVGCKDLFHEKPEEETGGETEASGTSPMPAMPLEASLNWLDSYAVAGGIYTITLNADESLARQTLSYDGKTVGITLIGAAAERTISLDTNGFLFAVRNRVTLTLGNNVTLQGRIGNSNSLVLVDNGGRLVMNSGSKITGNTSVSSGGGVAVYGGFGNFTMNGGTISGNSVSYYGGGVYIDRGTFTMNDGIISGNSAIYGGGVYVSNGTFTKQSSGTIYGSNAGSTLKNTATYGDSFGQAVFAYSGSGKRRDTTAGTGVTLDSEAGETTGGWE